MRKVRFYVSPQNIKDNLVVIDGQEFKHLHKVLRLNVGSEINIISSDGYVRECKITKINRDSAFAYILKQTKPQQTGANITVFLALIKADPLSNAVQKCTELGVKTFVPYKSEFSVIEDRGQIKQRLLRIGESACKQSGRLTNIEVLDSLNFDEVCKELEGFDAVIVAYEKEQKNAKEIISKLKPTQKIALVFGSEGGFSDKEIKKLLQLKNARFISLGNLILRADTAVLALVSAIKYELGDFTNENSNVNIGV